MNTNHPNNPESIFDIAAKLVMEGSKNIFLTGKAGTGKTTFLKFIKENCSKNLAIVAPTGVAAINAGGVTIHSFFQIPFSPFIPEAGNFSPTSENINSYLSRLKIRGEKRRLIRELELLIIDEVSMVRCDILDAIDTVLRFIRRRPDESFGGVQLLLIGDMFQLPPVVKENEWSILNRWYNSPYFFECLALKKSNLLSIEFDKIYRQSDIEFIELLNRVRNNNLDNNCLELFQKLYKPLFNPKKKDGYIILTTHNDKARKINERELNEINKKEFIYKAEIENNFPENAYPADVSLVLKVGAQVMFIKNDSAERGKRYFNGKIGTVTSLESDKILVKCEEENPIEVKIEKWENITYTLNNSSREIEEEVLGSFSQFPLRLAWAITIHKSQGLTFEKAIIDAGNAFAPGQVYVALSRCTSMEGIVLLSKIPISGLKNDPSIVQFCANTTQRNILIEESEIARQIFIRKNWISTFHFSKSFAVVSELNEYIQKNAISFDAETILWAESIYSKIGELEKTAEKFRSWLHQNFELSDNLKEIKVLQERTKKAVPYFLNAIEGSIELIQGTTAQTDSYLHAKEFNENVKELFAQLSLQKHLIAACTNGFEIEEWTKQKQQFKLPGFNVNAHSLSSNQKITGDHPELQQQLRQIRNALCEEYDLPVFRVAKNKSIAEMAEKLPQNAAQLTKITGFGKIKVQQFGRQFIDCIKLYCQENKIDLPEAETPLEQPLQKKQKRVNSSQLETFQLFNSGKSIAEIAEIRNLSSGTIEGHLAHFVKTGELEISSLLNDKQLEKMNQFYHYYDGKSISSLKEHLPEFSYSELRFFINHQKFLQDHSG